MSEERSGKTREELAGKPLTESEVKEVMSSVEAMEAATGKPKNAAEIAAEKKEKARRELAGKPLEGDELRVIKEITETQAICGKEGCGANAKIQVLQGNPDKMKFQAVRMACTRESPGACLWVSVPFEAIGMFCNNCRKSTLHGIPGGFFQGAYVCLTCRHETPKGEVEHDTDKLAAINPEEADQEPM